MRPYDDHTRLDEYPLKTSAMEAQQQRVIERIYDEQMMGEDDYFELCVSAMYVGVSASAIIQILELSTDRRVLRYAVQYGCVEVVAAIFDNDWDDPRLGLLTAIESRRPEIAKIIMHDYKYEMTDEMVPYYLKSVIDTAFSHEMFEAGQFVCRHLLIADRSGFPELFDSIRKRDARVFSLIPIALEMDLHLTQKMVDELSTLSFDELSRVFDRPPYDEHYAHHTAYYPDINEHIPLKVLENIPSVQVVNSIVVPQNWIMAVPAVAKMVVNFVEYGTLPTDTSIILTASDLDEIKVPSFAVVYIIVQMADF